MQRCTITKVVGFIYKQSDQNIDRIRFERICWEFQQYTSSMFRHLYSVWMDVLQVIFIFDSSLSLRNGNTLACICLTILNISSQYWIHMYSISYNVFSLMVDELYWRDRTLLKCCSPSDSTVLKCCGLLLIGQYWSVVASFW